jgi:hypothetical protein
MRTRAVDKEVGHEIETRLVAYGDYPSRDSYKLGTQKREMRSEEMNW